MTDWGKGLAVLGICGVICVAIVYDAYFVVGFLVALLFGMLV